MTTTTYRNEDTGYRVTLTDNGRGARVTDSKGYDFPMVGSDYPHAATLARSRAQLNGAVLVPQVPAPAPVTSPLTPETQVRSAAPLATGATLTMPLLPQARCLAWSARGGGNVAGCVRRGYASVTGQTATHSQLIGMARRGWMTLDHSYRPTFGTITDAGRHALAAYVAKHGEVL